MTAISEARRVAQCVFAIIFCLFSAGVIFGFAALKPVLIRHGVYHELCGEEQREHPLQTCTEQDLRLNFMFTLSTVVTNAAALPVGILLDRAGPWYTSILGAIFFALGNFFFGLQIVTPHIDTYYIGYICLAIGGPMIFLASFHLSNVFPKNSGLVLGFIVGAFDTSSLPYLVYNALDKWQGISIRTFFWGYLIIPVLLLIEQLTIGPRTSYKLTDFESEVIREEDDETNSSSTPRPGYLRTASAADSAVSSPIYQESNLSEQTIRPGDLAPVSEDPLVGALFGQSLKDQLLSSYFWIILFFLCVYMVRINWFIQTVFQQLLFYLHDFATADKLTTAFTVLLPVGGVVGIPIIGWSLDNRGSGFAASLILILGISYGILGVMPHVVPQTIAIAIFVILRPLMYTFFGDYSTKAFGIETFGTVYGLINCISGIFCLVLRPMDVFTKGPMRGDYTPVNVLGITLGAISASAVMWRIYSTRRPGAIVLP